MYGRLISAVFSTSTTLRIWDGIVSGVVLARRFEKSYMD